MVSSSKLGWLGFGPGSGVSGEKTAVRVGVAVRDVVWRGSSLGLWEPLERRSLKTDGGASVSHQPEGGVVVRHRAKY